MEYFLVRRAQKTIPDTKCYYKACPGRSVPHIRYADYDKNYGTANGDQRISHKLFNV